MSKTLCIYHGKCADGFTAAWVVRKFFKVRGMGDIEFYPATYQRPAPDVKDKNVIIVDFSYKRQVMMGIASAARSVLVLDHHKTAEEDLAPGDGIVRIPNDHCWPTLARLFDVGDVAPGVWAQFDMNRSGAGIAWDFFFPDHSRPTLIDHIEDRDLWRWALPKSREINANMFSYKYDFEMWDTLISLFDRPGGRIDMIEQGAAIERKHHKDIDELLRTFTRPMRFTIKLNSSGGTFESEVVPAGNLPYTMAADAAHALLTRDFYGAPSDDQRHRFAACYCWKPQTVYFSLRSEDGGLDVGEIAKCYGGGGHKHAAGFEVPHSRMREFDP